MAVLSPRAKLIDPSQSQTAIPRLENGDRLSRAEFERRFEAMPELKKAESIEGEVYVGSPVRHRQHGKPHGQIMTWIGTYSASTPGVEFGDNSSIRLDLNNGPQPDAFLMIESGRGGQARVGEDDYVEGGGGGGAERAASTGSYDLGKKVHAYGRNRGQEKIGGEAPGNGRGRV